MLRIEIATDNAAFEGNYTAEAARILREIAGRIERGSHSGPIRDANGNTVGRYELERPGMPATYYAREDGAGMWELRQTRYRARLESGREHPHDVCAVARSKDELREISAKLDGPIDWGD